MENDLPRRRADLNWSQAELAARVGVSRQTIISLEKGRFDPGLGLAFKLAEALGCRIDDVFSPDSDRAPS